MPLDEVVHHRQRVVRGVQVADVLEEVSQVAVQTQTWYLRLLSQQPFPELAPVECVVLEGCFGQFQESELDGVVGAQEVEILGVACHEV